MKTAISMPDDLYQAVIGYASGRKFSTSVCELIRKALSGDKNQYTQSITPVIPSDSSYTKVIPDEWKKKIEDEIRDIRSSLLPLDENTRINTEAIIRCGGSISAAFQQIVEMQSREKLTVQDLDNFEDKLRELQARIEKMESNNKVIPEEQPEVTLNVIPKVQPKVIPNAPVRTHASMMASPGKDDRLILTPELQNQVISLVDGLKESGMLLKDIALSAGINQNTMKGLVNRKNPAKTIRRDEYDHLVKLSNECINARANKGDTV